LEDLASVPSGNASSIAASVPVSATVGSTTSFQAAPAVVHDPPVLQDFDALINKEVKKYNELSNEIGSIVEEQVGSPHPPKL